MKRKRRRPYAAPCHDPLDLWFLEFEREGQVLRRYFADGPEARAALAVERARLTPAQLRMLAAIRKNARADGWTEWGDVYTEWDPGLGQPSFVSNAAAKVWQSLLRRGLVAEDPSRPAVVRVVEKKD